MRNILPLLAAFLVAFAFAGDLLADQPTRCPNKSLCPSPSQPDPTPPPQFDFPDDVEVDVEVDSGDSAAGEESTLAAILSAIAAIGGAASGYMSQREDPDESQVAADEVVPEPDVVV